MVIDSTGYAEMTTRCPVMFHMVWESGEAKIDSILRNGLERTASHYDPHWASRPGHTYLATRDYLHADHLAKLRQPDAKILRVDTARLEPARINPDEDHFLPYNPMDLGERNLIKGRHVLRHFHKPWPPAQWLREWTDYLGITPLPSLGEWADQVDLGADPAETKYSLAKGSLAYDGVVPPAAISLVEA